MATPSLDPAAADDTLARRAPRAWKVALGVCGLAWLVLLLARTRFAPAGLSFLCDAGTAPRLAVLQVALVVTFLLPLRLLRRARELARRRDPVVVPPAAPRRRLSPRKRLLFAAAFSLALLLGLYLAWTIARARSMYGSIKDTRRGWSGRVHANDPLLGVVPIPDSRGQEHLPVGPPVLMRYDAQGFRVPVADEPPRSGPCVLALGCSFTYGAACVAEDTYPHRLGVALGRRSVNAGVGSYGLAQMLLRGRRLIPELRPGLVVVQYTPWLVDRAQTPYAPSYFGALTVPYLGQGAGGELVVVPPPFGSWLFDLPIPGYFDSPRGGLDFASFFSRVGLPLLVHDDLGYAAHGLRRRLGLVPPPFADRRAMVELVYGELADLCQREGARMLVVLLSPVDEPGRAGLEAVRARTPFPIVDAHASLIRALPEPGPDAFSRRYEHWRGDPPVCVDTHPNAAAHALFADALLEAIASDE